PSRPRGVKTRLRVSPARRARARSGRPCEDDACRVVGQLPEVEPTYEHAHPPKSGSTTDEQGHPPESGSTAADTTPAAIGGAGATVSPSSSAISGTGPGSATANSGKSAPTCGVTARRICSLENTAPRSSPNWFR